MSIIKTARRNLYRNKRRTIITFAAIFLNTMILVASYALMLGLVNDLVHNATDLYMGEVQIHDPKYRKERSIYDDLDDPWKIIEAAKDAAIGAAARSYGFGLISHANNSAGVRICGIHPDLERTVTKLHLHLLAGSYLGDTPSKTVVLGRKLARTLDVKPGDEVVMVVQAADGSLGNDIYHVAGVLKSVGEAMDRSMVLLHYQDMEDLFALGGRYHEIVLNTFGRMAPEQVSETIRQAAGRNEVKTWRQLLPALNDMLDSMNAMLALFGAIFFLAAGLGVLNTMLMATFERTREFGLLKAIGASPFRIVMEVCTEALLLCIAGTSTGAAAGAGLAWYWENNPIDLTVFSADGFSTMGIAMSPLWKATLTWQSICIPVIVMWIVSFLAVLWPAVRAARLVPVEALSSV